MPLITDLVKKKEITSKFQKKEYRPWDISISNTEPDKSVIHDVKTDIIGHNNIESSVNDISISSSDLEKEWRNLYGAKKEVFLYMIKKIDETYETKVVTQNITLEQLVADLQLPSNTIKGALYQLKKSNLLYTEENKPGRGGYARYKIIKDVFLFFQTKTINI